MDGWRLSSKKLVCSGTSLVHFTFLSLSSFLGIGSPFITKFDHILVEISTIGISGASLSKYGKKFFMKKRYCKSSWCDTPEKDTNSLKYKLYCVWKSFNTMTTFICLRLIVHNDTVLNLDVLKFLETLEVLKIYKTYKILNIWKM